MDINEVKKAILLVGKPFSTSFFLFHTNPTRHMRCFNMIFPKRFVHISLLFFAITALSGIWMRLFYTTQSVQITEYTHILHGHSHMATLGWTFIAVFILFLAMIWQEIPNKKQAKAILWSTFIVTVIMFFAFLYQGYALYSIILSTIHIFIEYWMIIFIIITTR